MVLLMAWLPISQAAASCCPQEKPASNAEVVAHSAGHHCGDEAPAMQAASGNNAKPLPAHLSNCASVCVQLGQMPLTMQLFVHSAEVLDTHQPISVVPRPLPAHPTPLFRPPAALQG